MLHSVGIGVMSNGNKQPLGKSGSFGWAGTSFIDRSALYCALIHSNWTQDNDPYNMDALYYPTDSDFNYDFDEALIASQEHLKNLIFKFYANSASTAFQVDIVNHLSGDLLGSISIGQGSNLFEVGSMLVTSTANTGHVLQLVDQNNSKKVLSVAGSAGSWYFTISTPTYSARSNGAIALGSDGLIASAANKVTSDSLTALESDVTLLTNKVDQITSSTTKHFICR